MIGAVHWIRHGTCLDGLSRPRAHARPDSPLTPLGMIGLLDTARTLADLGERPCLVLSSPLPRATSSAHLLATAWGAPVAHPRAMFSEWRAPTCVLGRCPEEYPTEYRQWRARRNRDPDAVLPGGESLRSLARRSRLALATARAIADRQGTIAVVSHRVLIGCVRALAQTSHTPQELFTRACQIDLPSAGIWSDRYRAAPSPENATGSYDS